MNPKIVTYTICIILIFTHLKIIHCQDFNKPFKIHPVIGDTLDNIEATEFELFTNYDGLIKDFLKGIDGFQWAIFYIQEDSVVYVRAQYEEHDSLHFHGFRYAYNFIKKIRGKIDRKMYKKNYPWSHAFYLLLGFGSPQLYRFEFGYSSTKLSIGITMGANHRSSKYNKYSLIGIALTISLPASQKFSPYVFANYGLSVNSIFGIWDYEADKIFLLYAGSKIPIGNSILFRPETGVAYTTSCIENCGGFPSGFSGGQDVPKFQNKIHLGFNLAFEFYFF